MVQKTQLRTSACTPNGRRACWLGEVEEISPVRKEREVMIAVCLKERGEVQLRGTREKKQEGGPRSF